MSPWSELALSLVFVVGAVPGWGLVAWLERRAGEALEPETRLAGALAAALIWAQIGLMALGFLGLLTPSGVLGWLALGAVLGASQLRGAPRPTLAALWPLLALAPILGMALVPPWYRDELVYHLALPRAFALAGGYVTPDDNVFASFPLGWETILSGLYVVGQDGEPPINPRLMGAWTAGAAALGVAGLARALGASPTLARAAGAAFLLAPTVQEFGASAYVEPCLVLLSVLALRLVLAARERPAWAVVAGALAGLAASVKYPGLAVGLGGLLLLWRGPRAPYLVALVLAGSPFYLRNLIERGNPFFPLAWELLGGEGWDAWRAWAYRVTLQNYGQGREPMDWLLLLPRLFTTRDLRDGFEGSIGPLALVGLLAGLRGGEGRRRAVWAFSLGWLLFWALTVQQVRFALVGIATLLALTAAVLSSALDHYKLDSRLARGAAAGALLAIALGWGGGPLVSLWARQHTTAWLSGAVTRDVLLDRLLPESYAVTRALSALVPPEGRVWLVWTRAYTYYLARDYRIDCVFEAYRMEALLDLHEDPATFGAALAAEGFTHVLVNHRFFLTGTNADLEPGRTERLRGRWRAALESGALVGVERWGPVALYAVSAPVE